MAMDASWNSILWQIFNCGQKSTVFRQSKRFHAVCQVASKSADLLFDSWYKEGRSLLTSVLSESPSWLLGAMGEPPTLSLMELVWELEAASSSPSLWTFTFLSPILDTRPSLSLQTPPLVGAGGVWPFIWWIDTEFKSHQQTIQTKMSQTYSSSGSLANVLQVFRIFLNHEYLSERLTNLFQIRAHIGTLNAGMHSHKHRLHSEVDCTV